MYKQSTLKIYTLGIDNLKNSVHKVSKLFFAKFDIDFTIKIERGTNENMNEQPY